MNKVIKYQTNEYINHLFVVHCYNQNRHMLGEYYDNSWSTTGIFSKNFGEYKENSRNVDVNNVVCHIGYMDAN